MADDWTDEENDAIVADYFAMLADDVARRPYNKDQHNRTLQTVIGRPRGSIEYKHQNISAVLKGLGEDWIPGYKPAFNFADRCRGTLARSPSRMARFGLAPRPNRRAAIGARRNNAVDRPTTDSQQRTAAA